MWLTYWLGTLLKSVVFDVKDGNEDRDNLSDPANYGLENTNNIYFPPLGPAADTDRIAGWFIRSLEAPSATVSMPRAGGDTCPEAGCSSGLGVAELGAEDCVFILLHGNAKNRGAAHRLAAYRVWQSLSCHTLTLDYRGYGDSVMAAQLGESTVVEDAKTAIKLVRDTVGDKPKLILYGHSMGTGVAAHAAAEAMEEGLGRVDGVILDSPFHSFKKAMESSFLSYFFDLVSFMKSIDLEFDNVKWLLQLRIPVRVFHAVSDTVTPLEGARQLVQDVKEGGKTNIDLVVWEEEDLGHIGISRTKTFRQEIINFMNLV